MNLSKQLRKYVGMEKNIYINKQLLDWQHELALGKKTGIICDTDRQGICPPVMEANKDGSKMCVVT